MSTLDTTTELAGIFDRNIRAVYRVCYSFLGNPADAEDAAQSTFMKLVRKPRVFENAEHEKAWLVVCASNLCRDMLKSAQRTHRAELPPDMADEHATVGRSDALEAVLALPERYKDCVYLHYYEGYKTDEIAQMLDVAPSTIRNRLSEARALLKKQLGGDTHDR